jgi:asparagine synthase (glutamine-hydrolysing)
MFKHWNQDYCWPGINEGEEKLLFTDLYYEQIRDRAFSSLQSALRRYEGAEYISRLTYFDIENQSTRLTNLNTLYQRAYFEARYPFCDYALVEFVLALPFHFRVSNRLYLSVITKSCPEVTWVPRDKDNLLPTSRTLIRQGHALLHRVYARLVNRGLFTLHNDPEGWLRNDLRGWAEDLLFDQRTLERGIFNPAYIQSIYRRHISGKEIHTIGKIAPIMTYEMMLRRFYD